MKMLRSLIYGRYDVLKHERGYQVFDWDPRIPENQLKEIVQSLCDLDPDHFIAPRLSPYFLYFPLRSGDWLFAKGSMEERGTYVSYIVQGVLLDANERASLWHNPFLLADQLNPEVGDRRRRPEHLPLLEPISEDLYLERLASALHAFQAKDENFLHKLGNLLTQFLQSLANGNTEFCYRYEAWFDEQVLLWLFFLLPYDQPDRKCKEYSLSSFGEFIDRPLMLKGMLRPESVAQAIPLQDNISPTGKFLYRALHFPMNLNLAFLLQSSEDWHELYPQLVSPQNDNYFALFIAQQAKQHQALSNPSRWALGQWLRAPAFTRTFKQKTQFLLEIWGLYLGEVPTEQLEKIVAEICRILQADLNLFSQSGSKSLGQAAGLASHMLLQISIFRYPSALLELEPGDLLGKSLMNQLDIETIRLLMLQPEGGKWLWSWLASRSTAFKAEELAPLDDCLFHEDLFSSREATPERLAQLIQQLDTRNRWLALSVFERYFKEVCLQQPELFCAYYQAAKQKNHQNFATHAIKLFVLFVVRNQETNYSSLLMLFFNKLVDLDKVLFLNILHNCIISHISVAAFLAKSLSSSACAALLDLLGSQTFRDAKKSTLFIGLFAKLNAATSGFQYSEQKIDEPINNPHPITRGILLDYCRNYPNM